MNRTEGDEEEVIFDENEDGDDDEADIDAVSLVYEFCYFFSENLSGINSAGNNSQAIGLTKF